MLYNNSVTQDKLNILEFLDSFSKAAKVENLAVDLGRLDVVCLRMRDDFPCSYGIDNASIFKKAATFVTCFIESSPLDRDAFKNGELLDDVKSKNANAVVALSIAFKFMSLAKVTRSDDAIFYINKGIKLSWHSYCDMLDMLSHGVNLNTHFMSLSLLFEQIVYKTHKEIQYNVLEFALDPIDEDVNARKYPSLLEESEQHPEWDDYIGFWSDTSRK